MCWSAPADPAGLLGPLQRQTLSMLPAEQTGLLASVGADKLRERFTLRGNELAAADEAACSNPQRIDLLNAGHLLRVEQERQRQITERAAGVAAYRADSDLLERLRPEWIPGRWRSAPERCIAGMADPGHLVGRLIDRCGIRSGGQSRLNVAPGDGGGVAGLPGFDGFEDPLAALLDQISDDCSVRSLAGASDCRLGLLHGSVTVVLTRSGWPVGLNSDDSLGRGIRQRQRRAFRPAPPIGGFGGEIQCHRPAAPTSRVRPAARAGSHPPRASITLSMIIVTPMCDASA